MLISIIWNTLRLLWLLIAKYSHNFPSHDFGLGITKKDVDDIFDHRCQPRQGLFHKFQEENVLLMSSYRSGQRSGRSIFKPTVQHRDSRRS